MIYTSGIGMQYIHTQAYTLLHSKHYTLIDKYLYSNNKRVTADGCRIFLIFCLIALRSQKYLHSVTGTHVAQKVAPNQAGILSISTSSFDSINVHHTYCRRRVPTILYVSFTKNVGGITYNILSSGALLYNNVCNIWNVIIRGVGQAERTIDEAGEKIRAKKKEINLNNNNNNKRSSIHRCVVSSLQVYTLFYNNTT